VNRRFAAVLLALPILLAACGGGGSKVAGDKSSDASTDQSSDKSSDRTDQTDQTDQQTDRSVSAKGDKAAGQQALAAWTKAVKKEGFTKDTGDGSAGGAAGTDASDISDNAGNSDLVFTSTQCKQFGRLVNRLSVDNETSDLSSDIFTKGALVAAGDTQETVQASVIATKKATDMESVFTLLGSDKLPGCLQEAFTNSFQSDAPPGSTVDVKVTTAKVPTLGDQQGGFDAQATLTGNGVSIPLDVSFVFVRKGRVGVALTVAVVGATKTTADVPGELKLLVTQATK
jgi:hypothetical protein